MGCISNIDDGVFVLLQVRRPDRLKLASTFLDTAASSLSLTCSLSPSSLSFSSFPLHGSRLLWSLLASERGQRDTKRRAGLLLKTDKRMSRRDWIDREERERGAAKGRKGRGGREEERMNNIRSKKLRSWSDLLSYSLNKKYYDRFRVHLSAWV